MAAVAGPEFGEYEGCVVIIEKALYGLKSSGAAWHAHLSEKLRADTANTRTKVIRTRGR